MREPGWPGWSQAAILAVVVASWEGVRGRAPTVLRSSLESRVGCFKGGGVAVVSERVVGVGLVGGCVLGREGEGGGEGGQQQPWLARLVRAEGEVVVLVVEGWLLLTGNVPVSRMWTRASCMSGMEMASGQSQSTCP